MAAVTYLASLLFLISLFFSSVAYSYNSYGSRVCYKNPSDFECHVVKRGESWGSLFPNDYQRDLVMRVNRINISLRPGMTIAIPRNLSSASTFDYSPFPQQINPPGKKIIIVSLNPAVLAWGAYSPQGNLQHWGPVSGGQDWCPDINRGCRTSVGKFAIYHKKGAGCKSSKFPVNRGGAPMPYCMFFHGGFALHGSYDVPGYNASHGCVRLFVPDAKWLNEEFVGGGGVPVIVTRQI